MVPHVALLFAGFNEDIEWYSLDEGLALASEKLVIQTTEFKIDNTDDIPPSNMTRYF